MTIIHKQGGGLGDFLRQLAEAAREASGNMYEDLPQETRKPQNAKPAQATKTPTPQKASRETVEASEADYAAPKNVERKQMPQACEEAQKTKSASTRKRDKNDARRDASTSASPAARAAKAAGTSALLTGTEKKLNRYAKFLRGSSHHLQDALILSEIIAPPKALRDF